MLDEARVHNESQSSRLSLEQQRVRWLQQANSVPDLVARKAALLPRTRELLQLIHRNAVHDLDESPVLTDGGASQTWRAFAAALRAMGLVGESRSNVTLTEAGEEFMTTGAPSVVATLLAERVKLFAEALGMLANRQLTVQELNDEIVALYQMDWTTLTNTRNRVTWLEVLGLVDRLAGDVLTATEAGRDLLKDWSIITPAAATFNDAGELPKLSPPPPAIAALLDALHDNPHLHDDRKTYNLWAPSPESHPSKIENVRLCIERAKEPIEKRDLLDFITSEFGLSGSSSESMLPFLKGTGLLTETRRKVFQASPAALAWLDTGSPVDLIRIVHANERFVGELIRLASHGRIARGDAYREGRRYGMNNEKVRWILQFLTEAELLLEPAYLALEATPDGRALILELPLAEPPAEMVADAGTESGVEPTAASTPDALTADLIRCASDPMADDKQSGLAFEESVARAFARLGFEAEHIGGSGHTDVLVKWIGSDGVERRSIVDAKSSASGYVSHTNVSDTGIGNHAEKHDATFVMVVAPGFSGDTIRAVAARQGWILVTAEELGRLVVEVEGLALRAADLAVMFQAPDGLAAVRAVVAERQRELGTITRVISLLASESAIGEDSSPRDIALIERHSGRDTSLSEILTAIGVLNATAAGAIETTKDADDPQHTTYRIGEAQETATWLRALAAAIDRGLQP